MLRINCKLIYWLLFIFAIFQQGICLKDIQMQIPEDIKPGDEMTLSCLCDFENENIYAVKWYFGQREFYRYVTHEKPSKKFFPVGDILIDLDKSTQNSVVLKTVTPKNSGKYQCEISADAPTFDSLRASGEMIVTQLPKSGPIIKINNFRVHDNKNNVWIGEKFKVSCISEYSNPVVDFKWSVNGFRYPSTLIESGPETRSDIIVNVDNQILKSSQNKTTMFIRCETSIGNLYNDSVETELNIIGNTDKPIPLFDDKLEETDLQAVILTLVFKMFLIFGVLVLVLIISIMIYRDSQ